MRELNIYEKEQVFSLSRGARQIAYKKLKEDSKFDLLSYCDDKTLMKFSQIAKELGFSYNETKQLYNSGMKKIKKALLFN